MKNLVFLFSSLFFLLIFSDSLIYAASPATFANRIEGRVYDQSRNPLSDVDVELMNDVGSLLNHTRTNSSGRFSFFGLSTGRFKVRVLALRLGLREQVQDVEIVNLVGGAGGDTAYLDFYLAPDKRKTDALLTTPDAVFVQEIPSKAKEAYQKGLEYLEKNDDKSTAKFEEAVQIFPTYFDALRILGQQYINHKEYEKGYPYLIRAVDVNSRSMSSYYSLALAFMQINQIPAAVEAAKACVFINPSVVESQLLYGIALRTSGNYSEAESALLKAKSLAKKPVPEIHWQLALLYNKLKKNQEAAAELETYLKVLPNTPDKAKVEELIKKLKNSK